MDGSFPADRSAVVSMEVAIPTVFNLLYTSPDGSLTVSTNIFT